MNLIYFKREAYDLLKKDLNNVEALYYQNDAWLEEYFAKAGMEEFYKTSSIVVPHIVLSYNGDDNDTKNADDLINVRALYSSFKDKLTPLQASDPLLWTALCHLPYRQYVLDRWKKGDGTVTIKDRFFCTKGRVNLAYYNAISRLWWSGYLTYDEEKESSNPYHLTEILFSAQQIQKDLIDQPFCMNRVIVKGLLRALAHMQEERGNYCTGVFRDLCNIYLNHYGVVTILDVMTEKEIEDLAYNWMKNRP